MTFLHASLLVGCLLAVVPVAFHLLGRRQPKAIPFPAVRFVRKTAVQAQKGWTVKRWLLLAMRTLLVLLVAFALASPRVPTADFANYLLIGMLGLLAILATSIATTAVISRKGKGIVLVATIISALLWGATGIWAVATTLGGTQKLLPATGGPIAVALVVDTSPSMGYQYQNQSRLDAAKETANWLMDRLPVGSQIAIVNSEGAIRLLSDRASANRQLDRTVVEGKSALLPQRIVGAIDALRGSELGRKEIYVLTDLSTKAWQDVATAGIADKLNSGGGSSLGGVIADSSLADNSQTASGIAANVPSGGGTVGRGANADAAVLLQVIDVSIPDVEKRNWGIRSVELSQSSVIPGGSLSVDVEVEGYREGTAEQMTVELHTEAIDRNLVVRGDTVVPPELTVVDKQLVQVPAGGSVHVRLLWRDIAEGTNHAQVRLSRPDPLAVDNVEYLSVEGRAQGESLVVSHDPRDAALIAAAIEPESVLQQTASVEGAGSEEQKGASGANTTSRVRTESYAKFGVVTLADYSNIILYDPSGIDADTCDKLKSWVESGGGLMIVLGSAFRSADEVMASPVSQLLPGTVKRLSRRDRADRDVILAPAISNHPIWRVFERPIEEIPWASYPVFRHWDMEDLSLNAYPLMRFTQSQLPALIEESRGKGRVITWTVPYPEAYSMGPGEEWSELFRTTSADWPGYALFLGAVQYLASWSDEQLNYIVDQPAILANSGANMPQKYQLFEPNGEQTAVESDGESLVYNYTRYPGVYRLKGLRPQGPVVRGFSVNVASDQVDLSRVAPEVLSQALGESNYKVAKDRNEIETTQGENRFGRDLAPYILVFVVMLFMAEQTMASRFYGASSKASSKKSSRDGGAGGGSSRLGRGVA